jgi:hypothetical protein
MFFRFLFQLADFTGQSLKIRLEVGIVLLDVYRNLGMKLSGKGLCSHLVRWAAAALTLTLRTWLIRIFPEVETTNLWLAGSNVPPALVHHHWRMSLARPIPRVFSFSARLTQARLSSRQTLLVYRTFASSSTRLQATPVEDQKIVKPVEQHPFKYTPVSDAEDPYKGGPSAIDKAVHLFFFTEIVRGPFDFTRVHATSPERLLRNLFRRV